MRAPFYLTNLLLVRIAVLIVLVFVLVMGVGYFLNMNNIDVALAQSLSAHNLCRRAPYAQMQSGKEVVVSLVNPPHQLLWASLKIQTPSRYGVAPKILTLTYHTYAAR